MEEKCHIRSLSTWSAISSQASGWLNNLGLLVVVDDSSLAWNVFDDLTVDVVDLGHVVGDVQVVEVLVGHDSLCVQVVAVDLGDNGLVELCVVVVLSDDCLQVGVLCLDNSQLSWELDLLSGVDASSNWWWSPA